MHWVWIKYEYEFPFTKEPLALLKGDVDFVLKQAAAIYTNENEIDPVNKERFCALSAKVVSLENPDVMRFFRVSLDSLDIRECFPEESVV